MTEFIDTNPNIQRGYNGAFNPLFRRTISGLIQLGFRSAHNV